MNCQKQCNVQYTVVRFTGKSRLVLNWGDLGRQTEKCSYICERHVWEGSDSLSLRCAGAPTSLGNSGVGQIGGHQGWMQKVSQTENNGKGKWLRQWEREEGTAAKKNIMRFHQSTLAPRHQGGVEKEKPNMSLKFLTVFLGRCLHHSSWWSRIIVGTYVSVIKWSCCRTSKARC